MVGSVDSLAIDSSELINNGGLIQAKGALAVDTHGYKLSNANSGTTGGIVGQAGVTLKTGSLDNLLADISAAGELNMDASGVLNNSGHIRRRWQREHRQRHRRR